MARHRDLIALCLQGSYSECMTVKLTIRNVSPAVRDQLAARASRQGKSIQEDLPQERERLAPHPTLEEVSDRIRQREALAATELAVDDVLNARDADRR